MATIKHQNNSDVFALPRTKEINKANYKLRQSTLVRWILLHTGSQLTIFQFGFDLCVLVLLLVGFRVSLLYVSFVCDCRFFVWLYVVFLFVVPVVCCAVVSSASVLLLFSSLLCLIYLIVGLIFCFLLFSLLCDDSMI